jgi:hypothetical protein
VSRQASSLGVLAVEKELAKNINLDAVINDFAMKKAVISYCRIVFIAQQALQDSRRECTSYA